jgi:hypothetical protein
MAYADNIQSYNTCRNEAQKHFEAILNTLETVVEEHPTTKYNVKGWFWDEIERLKELR